MAPTGGGYLVATGLPPKITVLGSTARAVVIQTPVPEASSGVMLWRRPKLSDLESKRKRPLVLPGAGQGQPNLPFEDVGALVVVGANGSGKSRLGAWIEAQPQSGREVHRIAAQRALSVPDIIQPRAEQSARAALYYGHETAKKPQQKAQHRWQSKPTTTLLNDFQHLLALLFAEEATRNKAHTEATRQRKAYVDVPESNIDRLLRIWVQLMPQRGLKFHDGTVTATVVTLASGSTATEAEPPSYPATEMSDGERVAIYLIGQALCAPSDSVVVIDEPEIHLHRSIMVALWDRLEQERPDCTFVYVTHDIHFAASRASARVLWVEKFDGKAWTWREVEGDGGLPRDLRLELLGNRRPVLFVEGEKESYDSQLLRHVYPHMHVVPRAACEKVVEATRAFNSLDVFHHLSAHGLIDRDYRPDTELAAYKAAGVEALPVAEIEGLFLLPDVVRAVADHLKLNVEAKVAEVEKYVVDGLKGEMETQIAERASYGVEYRLKFLDRKVKGASQLKAALEKVIADIDVDAAFAEATTALGDTTYRQVLRLYNRKSLPGRVSTILGLAYGEYPRLVLRIITDGGAAAAAILKSLREELPAFPTATSPSRST